MIRLTMLDLLRGDAKNQDEAANALDEQLSEINLLLCEAKRHDEAATKRDAKERSDIDDLRSQIDALRDEVKLQGAQLARADSSSGCLKEICNLLWSYTIGKVAQRSHCSLTATEQKLSC